MSVYLRNPGFRHNYQHEVKKKKNVTNWDTKYVAFKISEKQFAQELRGLFFHAKLMQFSVKMPKWMNPTFLLAALYISEF